LRSATVNHLAPPAPARSSARALAAGLAAVVLVTAAACGLMPPDPGSAARPYPSATASIPAGGVGAPDPGQALRGRTTTTAAPTTSSRHRSTLAVQLGEDVDPADLVVPPEQPATGSYRFIAEGADGPVAFDACRPVHYQVRIGPGPANGVDLVAEALGRVSLITGLRFVYDGPADAVPTSASFPAPNASVSLTHAFSPVVIGWAQREESDLWASESADTLGVGGPRTIVFANDERLSVSGFVLLAPSDSLRPGFGPGLTVGNVLLHEISHLVGLDHVDDSHEVMQARLDRSTPDGFGPGDRRGLWELGASRGCASAYLHPG
jgi:hypothetical protein